MYMFVFLFLQSCVSKISSEYLAIFADAAILLNLVQSKQEVTYQNNNITAG